MPDNNISQSIDSENLTLQPQNSGSYRDYRVSNMRSKQTVPVQVDAHSDGLENNNTTQMRNVSPYLGDMEQKGFPTSTLAVDSEEALNEKAPKEREMTITRNKEEDISKGSCVVEVKNACESKPQTAVPAYSPNSVREESIINNKSQFEDRASTKYRRKNTQSNVGVIEQDS